MKWPQLSHRTTTQKFQNDQPVQSNIYSLLQVKHRFEHNFPTQFIGPFHVMQQFGCNRLFRYGEFFLGKKDHKSSLKDSVP